MKKIFLIALLTTLPFAAASNFAFADEDDVSADTQSDKRQESEYEKNEKIWRKYVEESSKNPDAKRPKLPSCDQYKSADDRYVCRKDANAWADSW